MGKEKLYVVMKSSQYYDNPVFVYDNRRDARAKEKQLQARSKKYVYWVASVSPGPIPRQ